MTLRLVLFAAVLSMVPATAWGLSCSFGLSGVSFGAVSALSNAPVDTTGTLTINCTGGLALTAARICPNLGAGTGGANATTRFLQGGGGPLGYQLYQDAGRTAIWGSQDWGYAPKPPTIDIPLGLDGSGSTTRTIYARLFRQVSQAPGLYQSLIAGGEARFLYGYAGVGDCSSTLLSLIFLGVLLPIESYVSLAVDATLTSYCEVQATNLDFGSVGVLDQALDAASQLTVTCSHGTGYTVGLDGGLAAAPPTGRRMTQGAEAVTYGLYSDAARSAPWGDGPGNSVSGTGSLGLPQTLTVYGRIPSQATPSPGTYSDTVVVTVTY